MEYGPLHRSSLTAQSFTNAVVRDDRHDEQDQESSRDESNHRRCRLQQNPPALSLNCRLTSVDPTAFFV
ncbi:unnamed protein product [Heligmosomoides polygyrus]|uniref:Uncharacterized protein n=1 Tax=Heligmosomoides polygyrus TaxID=6339 RepID=A0A183FDM6_HELPZ|nr:unnamed protein product [Heligmosomoides polygyrus]